MNFGSVNFEQNISSLSHQGSNLDLALCNTFIEENKSRINFTRQVSTWTQQQLEKISNSYLEFGSSWTLIHQKLTTKSINTIKNKFNNTLRMAAKSLAEFQLKVLKRPKNSINCELLLTVLELVNKTQKEIKDRNLTINWQSKFFTFKSQILNYCFKPKDYTLQKTEQFIKLTNSINYKMRSYAIFKAKHFKSWKINQKVLNSMYSFDKFVKEQIVKFDSQEQTKSFAMKKEKNSKKSKDHQLQQSQQPVKNIINIQSIIKFNLNTQTFQNYIYEYESLIGQEQQEPFFKF